MLGHLHEQKSSSGMVQIIPRKKKIFKVQLYRHLKVMEQWVMADTMNKTVLIIRQELIFLKEGM